MSAATRREVLGRAAAITAGGAVTLPVISAKAGTPIDPHIQWYADWLAARQAIEDEPRDDDEVQDPLYRECWAIEDRIVQTVPTTLAGAVVVATVTAFIIDEVHDSGCIDQEIHGAKSLAAFVRGLS